MKRAIVSILILCACGPAFAAGPVRKVLLKNGFRLVTAPDSSLPLVGVCLGVGAGPAQEDETTGGASQVLGLSMLELPEGHPLRRTWVKTLELSGSDTEVTAAKDTMLLVLEIPSESLDTTLQVLAERVREPGRGLEGIDEIKARLLRSHTDRAATPLAHGKLGEHFESLAYGRHPYSRTRDGTPDAVRGLNRERLAEFQKKWWAPNNLVLTLTGDVDPDKALARVQELFGAMPAAPMVRAAPPEVALPEAPRKEILELAVESTAMQVGWIGPPASDPDIYAMRVLRALLAEGRTSRLRRRLVDRGGRVVTMDSDWQFLPQHGFISFDLVLAAPDPWPVVDDLVSEVERLRRAEVGAEELTRIKTFLAALYAMNAEDKASWAGRLTGFELIDDVYTAESFVSRLEQVTAAQVKAAAVKWMDPARMIVAGITPKGAKAVAQVRTESYSLPGGLTLTVRSRPGGETLGLCAVVRTGTASTDVKAHAAAALGARLLGATPRHSATEMLVQLESLGSKLRSQAQEGLISLQLNATQDTFDDVLTALRDMLMEPRIAAAELARERAQAVAELKEMLSNEDLRATLELMREIYPDRPAGQSLLDPDAISKVSTEDMSAWVSNVVVPARTVIAVSSSMAPEKVRDLVAAKFAGWNAPGSPAPMPKPLVAFAGRTVRMVPPDAGRASDSVFVAFRLPPETNKNFAAISVCVRALGIGKQSLFLKRLAKIDPTYQPLGIRYSIRGEGGVVTVGFRVERGKGQAVLKAIEEATQELSDPGPPEGDVADTRDFVLNLFVKEQQSRVLEAGTLAVATGMINDPQFFTGMAARYKAVTLSDVKRAAESFRSYRALVFEAGAK